MQRDYPPDQPADQKQSLWQQTAKPTALDDNPPLNETLHSDVAIIGGGFTGLSAALHLAKSNTTCVVLEAQTIGHGGSGRNVGLVNAGLWLPPKKVTQALGESVGGRLNDAFAEGPSLVFSLIEQHRIECEAQRNGTLHLAHSSRGLRELESRHRQLSDLSAPVSLLDRSATHAATGSAFYHGALHDARAGTIQPLAYARGLADAAAALGARIYCGTPVHAIEQEGQSWRLKTVRGEVIAKQVIIASNGYTRCLWPDLDRTIVPIHFFQFASEPLDDASSAAVLPKRNGCWDTQQLMMSLRKDIDGRLIFGSIGPARGSNDKLLQDWCERMRRRLFPELAPLQWGRCWHGRIAFTPNHLPRMYQLAPGVMTCIGYNGRGIAPGTVCGKAMAELINGAPTKSFPIPIENLRPVMFNRWRAMLVDAGARLLHHFQGRIS